MLKKENETKRKFYFEKGKNCNKISLVIITTVLTYIHTLTIKIQTRKNTKLNAQSNWLFKLFYLFLRRDENSRN